MAGLSPDKRWHFHRSLPRRIFLAALALMPLLPLVATVWHPRFLYIAPVDEHRAAAPFPPLSLLGSADGAFARQLNEWFDDHLGLRAVLIRTKNQIDYSLFDTSRRVYLGRDGWLFERATTDVRLAVERISPEKLQNLERAFTNLAQRLRKNGIHLIVVGFPDKSTIYPEMLPAQAPHLPPGGNYDKLRAFLHAQPLLTFIDAKDVLNREKSSTAEPLFYKGDLHINQMGSIPIVRAIVDRIAQIEGQPDIKWNETFGIAHANWEGSEARFLSLLAPTPERVSVTTLPYGFGRDEPDGHWNIPDPRLARQVGSSNVQAFDYEFRSRPELCPDRLPGLAVFGNSFSDVWWSLGLQRYFCFIRRSRTPIQRLPRFVDNLPQGTKYFIFQYVSAYLPGEGPWYP